jgi:3',5'-cyclic AMP phosphodiesterase CpdA
MLIAQISDLHLGERGVPGPLGIDAGEALAHAVVRLNESEPRPDLVVVSGDLVENGSVAQYEHLRERLAPLAIPHRLMPGNHDEREALRAVFAAHAYLCEGGRFIQYEVATPELHLVMLDSLIPGSHAGELCEERLAWLDARLCAQPAKPTIVFVHHPPLTTGAGHVDRTRLASADAFGAVIGRHPQVQRVACGHVHRAMLARWCGTVVSTCPSVVHQFALDLRADGRNTPSDEGPGWQLHRWHAGNLITYTVSTPRRDR